MDNQPLPDPNKLKFGIPDWLDRSMWQRLRFDQMAENVRDTGQPTPEDSASYIGLEHMDTGSLHVRRWGSEADLKGQKLKMRKGDILFARRNAYLRRVAIAPHDGFFSAHGMILRAKHENVLPEFLPYFMMSDRFMNQAVKISVGSLSPTINWSTLQLQEFYIPPLDQQRRLAATLCAMDAYKSQLTDTQSQLQVAHDTFVNQRVAAANGSITRLGVLSRRGELDIQTGPFGTVLQASSYAKAGTPIINPVNMRKHRLWVDDGPFLDDKECERLSRYRMRVGDILLGRKGDVGRAVLVTPEYDGYIVGSDLIRLRLINSEILPAYLYYFMLAPRTRTWIARRASGTTMPGINEKILNSIEIPVPSLDEQVEIIRTIETMNIAENVILDNIRTSENLILTLANWATYKP